MMTQIRQEEKPNTPQGTSGCDEGCVCLPESVQWELASVRTSWRITALQEILMLVQHMLVPVDFSPYAEQAVEYAIGLAQKLQARLTLLHVVDTTPLGVVEGAAMLPPSYWQALDMDLAQRLEEPLTRVQNRGLHGETVIVHGTPFQTIIETARDKGVDLIVMGTHGRTGLTHVLLGSVAEKVVRLAPCPVLVTRGTTRPSAVSEDAMSAHP